MKIQKIVGYGLIWVAILTSGSVSFAADGTWTLLSAGNASGSWNTTGNWSPTTADGSGFTADFSTLDITADSTITLDAARTIGNMTFGDTTTATAAGWIINAGTGAPVLTLAGTTPTITVNTLGSVSGVPKNVRINAVLDGTSGLTKAGNGVLVLNGNNTYTGTTTVSAGTLQIGAGSNTGTISGALSIASGATAAVERGDVYTLSSDISGSGLLQKNNSAGSLTLTGNNASFTGILALQDGALNLTSATNGGLGGGSIRLGFSGVIRSTDTTSRTFTNVLNLNNSSGSLRFGDTQGSATNTGSLTFTDTTTGNAMSGTSRITVTNATVVTLSKQFTGGRVNKWGTGTLILNGNSTTAGATTANEGLLVVNGAMVNSSVTITGSNPLGGGTLGGTGTLKDITLNAGGAIAPGNSIGTLSTSNGALTWNGEASASASQMKFELGNTANLGVSATSDLLALGTGVLTKGTGSFFQFDFLGTGAANNTYTLLSFGSNSGFSVGNFTYTNLGGGLTGTFNVTGTNLQFTTVPEPSTYVLLMSGVLVLYVLRRKSVSKA